MNDDPAEQWQYDEHGWLATLSHTSEGHRVALHYGYDDKGRRTGKRVWRRERDLTGWMSLSRKPEVTWYGWDGDRLTTIQTDTTRIQTVYLPGSFTPLIRVETENGEQAKARHRSLAEVLQEDTGVTLPAELAVMLGRLERELRAGAVSAESEAWLAQCGLTAAQMESQMEAEYIPERKLHLYHCDHRGLPQALISPEGETAWHGVYDEWGNLLGEENPEQLQQSLRLPGQQYDEESGLYYNRNRYYDPLQGRYITQDPIGPDGEWNLYQYPLDPISDSDPLGLKTCSCTVTFSAVGPRQATNANGALGMPPPNNSVAIDPKVFGLKYNNIYNGPERAATKKEILKNIQNIKIEAPGLSDYSSMYNNGSTTFTIGDIGDKNIRNSKITRFDIYRFKT